MLASLSSSPELITVHVAFHFYNGKVRTSNPTLSFSPIFQRPSAYGKVMCAAKRRLPPEEIERTLQLHTRLAKNMLVGTVARVAERIGSERPDIAKNVKMLPSDRRVRMRQWLDGLDRIGMYEVAVRSMAEGWVKDLTGFCRGKEWISWQYFRLVSVLANEYYYLRQMGGIPGNHRAEHDYQDMEYVLLLSRAEGLLTRDQRAVTPLAQAAFPDKDVFFKLDEVPEEYLCHWS